MSTALVTGGSRGIGRAICVAFARAGYDVAFCYSKDEAGAGETCRCIEAAGAGALPFLCDVTDEQKVGELFCSVPGLTVLVNNAGIAHYGLIQDTALEDWERVFAVNVRAAFLCTRAAIPKFLKRGEGCVVNISSIWGETGGSCEAAYSSSKAALIGFTKAAAKELAPSKIRVNCIAAGMIETEMNARFTAKERAAFVKGIPLGREGTPEEVAAAVLFLVNQPYMTGEVLRINGGALI